MKLTSVIVSLVGAVSTICPLVGCQQLNRNGVVSSKKLPQENVINDAPIPYMYGYGAQNEGGHHSHREVSDGLRARGSFTQTLSDGRTRTTEYIADEKGFRILAMRDVYDDPDAMPSPRPKVKPIKDEVRPRWNPTRTKPKQNAKTL